MMRIYLTDTEVAMVLEVSTKTLYRMLNGFHPKSRGVCGGRKIDISQFGPEVVSGVRRWRVKKVAEALEIGEDEVLKRVS